MTSDQLEQMYEAPPAGPIQTGRVTFDDVIMKTLGLFVLVLAFAAGSWFLTRGNPGCSRRSGSAACWPVWSSAWRSPSRRR